MPGEPAIPEFDIDRIKAGTQVGGVAFFRELGSTNDTALAAGRQADLQTPFLVLAERQTAGRGRGANRWWSADGALTFSLIIDLQGPQFPADRLPLVSLAAGLAIRNALAATAPDRDFVLKWPNDVHLEDRKLSGILVETAPSASGRIAIGVGINVNNSFASAPVELQATATSLADATGLRFDRTAVLMSAINEMQSRVQRLGRDVSLIVDEWRGHCLLDGRAIQLHVGTRTVAGCCRGIDDDGALLVETAQGTQRFMAGVVERVRKS